MSQYMQFFIRCEDKFVPLMTFSRRSDVYGALLNTNASVPYGKIAPVTDQMLEEALKLIGNGIDNTNRFKAEYLQDKEAIYHFNNTVDDKLRAVRDIMSSIDELDEQLEDAEDAKHVFMLFEDILDEAKYRDDDCPFTDYTENTVLYAGIEVSSYPTVNDILEEGKHV